MRYLLRLLMTIAVCVAMAVPGWTAQGKVAGQNGRIAFVRFNPEHVVYLVNPDGGQLKRLPFSGPSEFPRWSPDGSELSISARCIDGEEDCAATIVDPDSGAFRQFKWPDPTLETPCGIWSSDGQRLACEGFGVNDPSRNGIYTIRSSDGGGLTRITSNPGGDDNPLDYSPGGKRMVFVRAMEDVEDVPVGLFVVKLDGSGLRRVTPASFFTRPVLGASWSPTGNEIVFATQSAPDHRGSIWIVNADGSDLHQVPITPACGGLFSDPRSISCFQPGWSPDGTKIVFTRVSANGTQENIYTVNADGSGLSPITLGGGFRRGDSQPDWGTHALTT